VARPAAHPRPSRGRGRGTPRTDLATLGLRPPCALPSAEFENQHAFAGKVGSATGRDVAYRPGMQSTRAARSLGRLASWGPVVALTVLAAVLRFATLDRQSFWSDEAITVLLLRMDLVEMLRTIVETEATPPLYYVLGWGWTRVFGDGEVGLRSLSALAGTLTVPAAYAAGSVFFGRRAAIAAAALVAVSPTLVWYSQEARSYALAVLLCAVSFASLGRALRRPSGITLVIWAASSALALGTHYFAVFVVGAEALWLLAHVRSRSVLGAVVGVGAAGVALLPLALIQRGHGFVENFAAADSVGGRIAVIVKQLLVGEFLPYDRALAAALAVVLAVSFLILAPRVGPPGRRAIAIAGSVGAAPIVVPLALSMVGLDYLNTRNALVGLVPLAVALAGGLTAPGPRLSGQLAVASIACVLLFVTLAVAADPAYHRADWRGLARTIRAGTGPQVALVTPDHQGWFARVPLQVYLPEARAVDSGYADAVPQFARVSRRPVDKGTPSHVVARSVVLAGVGWGLPALPRPLPRELATTVDRDGHGYRFVRSESDSPLRLRTRSLSAPQSAILVLGAERR
jgi:mannosyltransferase